MLQSIVTIVDVTYYGMDAKQIESIGPVKKDNILCM